MKLPHRKITKISSPPPAHTRTRSSTVHLDRSRFFSFGVYISECTQQPQISLFEPTTSTLHTFKTQPCLPMVKSFKMQQSALTQTSKAPAMFLDRISSSTISIRLTVPVTKMFVVTVIIAQPHVVDLFSYHPVEIHPC